MLGGRGIIEVELLSFKSANSIVVQDRLFWACITYLNWVLKTGWLFDIQGELTQICWGMFVCGSVISISYWAWILVLLIFSPTFCLKFIYSFIAHQYWNRYRGLCVPLTAKDSCRYIMYMECHWYFFQVDLYSAHSYGVGFMGRH